MLLTWSTAGCLTVCLIGLTVLLRPGRAAWSAWAAPLAWEAAIIFALYTLWQKAGDMAVTHVTGAVAHADWVWRVERDLHLPSERDLQNLVLPHPHLVEFLNGYYAVVHVPALVVFLVWLFLRHPESYPRWRNVGALLTGAALLIQLIPVAPPRLMPQLGFVDTALRYGESVYGAGGIRNAPQLAAMPSLHVGWAVFVAVVTIVVSSSKWRWLVLAHPATTVFVVVATANHWWLDGIVAAALLPLAIVVEAGARRVLQPLWARVRVWTLIGGSDPEPAPAPVVARQVTPAPVSGTP
jgi:PAP2 superfamily